ncbi:MAG: AraC family transcriptional regulator [Candidatus Merdivicinus sp.]
MVQYRADDLLDPRENITVQRNVNTREEGVHTHNFLEIVYIAEGAGQQAVGGREYEVHRGALLFINYGQTHAFRTDSSMTYYNILLKPEFMGKELIDSENAFSLLSLTAFEEFRLSEAGTSPFCAFEGREMLEIETAAAGMYEEFRRKEAGYRTVLRGYLSVLLAKLFRKMALPDSGAAGKRQKSLAPEILAYIEEHCCEKLGLADLAQRCFYNPSYFSRIFKEYSGRSLTEFISEKRIERAKELLSATHLTVEEIAARTGYGDRGQFFRQFKSITGMTPKAFRDADRESGNYFRKDACET